MQGMNIILKTIFAVLLVLLAVPTNDYHITGTVTDVSGEPISDVRIELYNQEDELILFDSTSKAGTYELVHTATGIAETGDVINNFEVGEAYPNPIGNNSPTSISQIPVQISHWDDYQIEVYTITGQLVTQTQKALQSGTYTLNVSLPKAAGVYLVRVTGNGTSKVRKVTSLTGTQARIDITPGGSFSPTNDYFPSKQKAASQGLTLRVVGGENYISQEITISTPGSYTKDFILEPLGDFSCEDIELSAQATQPSVLVGLTGITEQLGSNPTAKLVFSDTESGGEKVIPTYVERINANEAKFLTPLHPINYMAGGETELIITSEDESVICSGIPFTISSMEPAPGLLSQTVDELETVFEDLAAKFGFGPEELRTANIHELDGFQKSIAVGLQMISSENNPNNLRNLLEGSAPALQEYEKDELFEVVEAVLAISGFDDKISTFSQELISANNHHEYDPNALTSWPNQQQSKIKSATLPDKFATPEHLNEMMNSHQYFANANSGINHEIREVTGLVLGSISVATGVIGLAPVSAATGLSAAAIAMIQLATEIAEHTLPSELQAMELEVDKGPEFLEETAEAGTWNATITARSKEWTLDYPTLLGNIPGLGNFAKILRKSGLIKKASQEMTELMIDIFQTHYTAIWNESGGPITIDSQEWGIWVEPGRTNEEDYFYWTLQTREQETNVKPFELGEVENAIHFTPYAVGRSRLIVSTQNDKFLGQLRTNNLFLEVKKIKITIQENNSRSSRSVHRIGKYENYEIDFWAELENSIDPGVKWELTVVEGLPPTHFGPPLTAEEIITLVGPSDLEERAVYSITATSMAKERLRSKKDAPSRTATTTVIVEPLELTVIPNPTCLELDMTPAPFTAYLDTEEIPISELSYQISGPGSLSSSGAYQPSKEGFVNITFTYELPNSDRQATAEVHFITREDCGQISVQSSKFNYTTDYAYAEIVNLEQFGGENLSSFSGFWANSDSETITITADTDISDEGEWTRDFFEEVGYHLPRQWWQMVNFIDANGDEWVTPETVPVVAGKENIKLTISRTEVDFAGVQLGIIDGTFTVPLRNYTAWIERDQEITTVVTGEIQAIPVFVRPSPTPPSY